MRISLNLEIERQGQSWVISETKIDVVAQGESLYAAFDSFLRTMIGTVILDFKKELGEM